MTDTRELALARLEAIIADDSLVPGVTYAARNLTQFPAGKRPALNLFDGPESPILPSDSAILSPNAPLILEMRPRISLLVGDQVGTLGTTVNTFRTALKKAVLNDTQLLSIIGASAGGTRGNGRIIYLGMTPFLGASLTLDADVEFEFGIYIREPNN